MTLGNTPQGINNVFLEPYRSYALDLTFVDADGAAYSLEGHELRIVVQAPQRYGGNEVIAMNAVVDANDSSSAQFPIQATDLALEDGEYPYDITLVNPDGYSIPTVKGFFIIGPNTDIDTGNTYNSVDATEGLLVTIGGGREVSVTVYYPPALKGDKGDDGPQGPTSGPYVSETEPGPDDDPPTGSAFWVDPNDNTLSGWVEEAPIDGSPYSRQDAGWVLAAEGGGGTYQHDELLGRDAADSHPVAAITGLQAALDAKSDTTHHHDDRYYTEGEVDSALALKAELDHNHDTRYYTQAQVDAALGNYAPVSHNHDTRYYQQSEVDAALALKSDATHVHDDRYYTETEVDDMFANITIPAHDHDDRYYTEAEIDFMLADLPVNGHTHDDRYYLKSEVDSALDTKAAVAHIHDDRYYTEGEVDAALALKSDAGHNHDGDYATPADLTSGLAGKADVGHNHDGDYSLVGHTHSYLPLAGGTMTGPIDMGGSRVVNAGDPQDAQDLVTNFTMEEGLGTKAAIDHTHGTLVGSTLMGWQHDDPVTGDTGKDWRLWAVKNYVDGKVYASLDEAAASDVSVEVQFQKPDDSWFSIGPAVTITAGQTEADAQPLITTLDDNSKRMRTVVTAGVDPSEPFAQKGHQESSGAPLNSHTVPYPADVVDGDLVVVFINHNNDVTLTPPTGFTLLGEAEADPVSPVRVNLYVYTATYVGGMSTTWTITGTASLFAAVAVAFSNGTVDSTTFNDNAVGGPSLALPSTSASTDGIMFACLGYWGGGNNLSHTVTHDFTFDDEQFVEEHRETASNQGMLLGWKTVTSGENMAGTFTLVPAGSSGFSYTMATCTAVVADVGGGVHTPVPLRVQAQVRPDSDAGWQ